MKQPIPRIIAVCLTVLGLALIAVYAMLYSGSGEAIVITPQQNAEAASNEEDQNQASDEQLEIISEVETIKVYVAGAVQSPGVYEFSEGARVEDAIEAAGGFTDEANSLSVNLAAYINDAQQITVYKEGENVLVSDAAAANGNGLVNINTGSQSELMTLNGIGESLSQAIIDYRERNGNFESTEDIKRVSGIGDKLFQKLEPYITVD